MKAILIILLLVVFYQDYKTQLVSWYLFPLIAFVFGVNFYMEINQNIIYYIYVVAFNFSVIVLILLILFLYSKLKMKMSFINTTFGIGDVLILFAVGLGFPSYTFLLLLSLSMLFAIGCYFAFKKKYSYQTVPLAGYMSLFFALLLFMDYMPFFPNLFAY